MNYIKTNNFENTWQRIRVLFLSDIRLEDTKL